MLLQLEITESMRRREGLVEQKAGLLSANETLEKEVKVNLQCNDVIFTMCIVFTIP